MAVIVSKSDGDVRYQSCGPLTLSEEDVQTAKRLDAELEKAIMELLTLLNKKRLTPEGEGRGSLLAYWYLGSSLRQVALKPELLRPAELPLFWLNAKIYLPRSLLYKPRGPNREHLYYCYRLAAYTQSEAKKMNWGEWVTIFDSPGINEEQRFDTWFRGQLGSRKGKINRQQIRLFAPFVNAMLKDIEVRDLTDEELFNCYSAAWQVADLTLAKIEDLPKGCRSLVQQAIKKNLFILDDVMGSKLSDTAYAEAYQAAQRAIADLKTAVLMILERSSQSVGLTNAEIGRALGIYMGHAGHEGHIPRTLLALLETEGVVEQDSESKRWKMRSLSATAPEVLELGKKAPERPSY